MNTGKEVKINNDTLVIATTFALGEPRRGGYISIFEFENGKWIEKKMLDTKKYLKEPYQAPMNEWGVENRSFLDAGDNIIALIAQSTNIIKKNKYEKAILIFQKSGNEWTHLNTIYKSDPETFYGTFIKGNFRTGISVDKNTVIVPEAGNVPEDGKGIHVFEIQEDETKVYLIPDKFRSRHSDGGAGIIRNDTIILSDIYHEDGKSKRRVKVYARDGGSWELAFIFDENSFPEIWTNQEGPFTDAWQRSIMGRYIGILDDNNLYTGSDQRVYFFRKDDHGYIVKQSIDISIKDIENDAPIMDLVIKDDIMAYVRGGKLYIYHSINDTWNLTDTIDLGELQLNKRFIVDVNMDISNDILVIGFDNVRKEWDSTDTIVTIPSLPFLYKRNPGSVCILKIHPNGGYDIQGIITRKYNLFGRVKFVNKVK